MPFPQSFLDELMARSDIVDVVGSYVQLTRKGANLFGLCPFHSEKTGSFSVSPDKQIYYCFGCKRGGGVINFIMEEENLVARAARKKRRCSSYEGEISEAPENLLRDEKGKHRFGADKPNELWITDVTEFRIPAGKAYLPAHRGLLRRHAAELAGIDLARCRDGQPAAARRVQVARRGRPSQDPLGPRLPLPLAGMDKDMR